MEAVKVLIIDDNSDDRALIIRAMRREFPVVEAVEAMDPPTLAQALEPADFDLAITDYQLNWSTGLQLLPILKSRLPGCPIIMFTATGSEEIAVKAMKAGLDDYVLKSTRHFLHLSAAARTVLERERLRKRAETSELRLHDLLTALEVGVYRTDGAGRLLEANPAFLRILGYESLDQAGIWTLEDAVVNPSALRDSWQELRRARMVRIPELQMRNREGKEIWISLALRQPSPGAGTIEGLIENISVRKWMDEALKRKDAELTSIRRLDSIGRLAGGVAHDFNNLLTAINGYSELLLEMVGEGNPVREDLVEINKAGIRAAALTRDLLAFSRRQILRPVELDLNGAVQAAEPLIRRTLGDDIEYIPSLAPDLRKVFADAGQLETVLVHLLTNAREAMPDGGTLTLRTENVRIEDGYSQAYETEFTGPSESIRAGDYVSLFVEDNGIGMDAETITRVFEPFFTTKAMGVGAGLGLSTVYGIVKQSDGQISVQSEPGRGTRFRIDLPAVGMKVEAAV
ncbi:MAG: response receiver sensor histidine kinase response regulator [Fibrobacteres bacterium]|nr:response receiver sensor histidine kinase response regulator [Fibrobacterota bacterium]